MYRHSIYRNTKTLLLNDFFSLQVLHLLHISFFRSFFADTVFQFYFGVLALTLSRNRKGLCKCMYGYKYK